MTLDKQRGFTREKTAAEYMEDKKFDMYYDKVFVRHLIKQFQKLSPDLGAVFYPHTQQVLFWYNGLIVYKVRLDEYNTSETSLAKHYEKCKMALTMIDANPELRERLQAAMSRTNKKIGKLL